MVSDVAHGTDETTGWHERLAENRVHYADCGQFATPNGAWDDCDCSASADLRAALAAAATTFALQEEENHQANPLCPSCGRQLRKTRDLYECDNCQRAWPLSYADDGTLDDVSAPAGVRVNRETLVAVAALHRPLAVGGNGGLVPTCAHCEWKWPCPTAAALAPLLGRPKGETP